MDNNAFYKGYAGSKTGFDDFNVCVLNMPRHEFRSMNIDFLKDMAMILSDIRMSSGNSGTIVELYCRVHAVIKNSTCHFRNKDFERFINSLFDTTLVLEDDIRKYYNDNDGKARNFRHLVELMRLWGLAYTDQKRGLVIDRDACEEFSMLDSDDKEALRSKMLAIDIIDNPFMTTLKLIKNRIVQFSYKPCVYILKYMREMHREVSKFEIANLLGIILPEFTSAEQIYDNAIKIGKQLPDKLPLHEEWFFDKMNWKTKQGPYRYAQSQAPTFKFNAFLLLMEDLGFLTSGTVTDSYALTDLSNELLDEDIPVEVAELDKYIDIAINSHSDKDLTRLIINNTKPSLLKQAANNDKFIEAMNARSINKPKKNAQGKKVRNPLIAELAKIRANYTDQVDGQKTFRDKHYNNYVEAHHIIEFNSEDGPDIVENLMVISPVYHELIHHACSEDLSQFYMTLRTKGIVSLERFKDMQQKYHCLQDKHVYCLYNKGLITNIEKDELLEYIKGSQQ